MISAHELRIGNWVEANSPFMTVSVINKYDVSLYMPNSEADCFDYNIEDLQPIPLTPEILLACGFHKHNNAWVLDDYSETDYNKDFFTIWNVHDGDYSLNTTQFPIEIKSLHQLQNLYFALIGEELSYNPSTNVK